jgi:hypothetical protein
MRIKLNGWQRIGVVLSVIWFVGFAGYKWYTAIRMKAEMYANEIGRRLVKLIPDEGPNPAEYLEEAFLTALKVRQVFQLAKLDIRDFSLLSRLIVPFFHMSLVQPLMVVLSTRYSKLLVQRSATEGPSRCNGIQERSETTSGPGQDRQQCNGREQHGDRLYRATSQGPPRGGPD